MREALAARSDHDFIAEPAPRRAKPRARAAPRAGLMRRALGFAGRYPLEIAIGTALAVAAGAIAWNALAMQKTRHPAPWFGRRIEAPMPPARPAAPAVAPAPVAAPAPAPAPAAAAVPSAPPRALRDAIGDLIRAGEAAPAPAAPSFRPAAAPVPPARPAAPAAASSTAPSAPAAAAPRDPIGDMIRLGAPAPVPPAPVGRSESASVAAVQAALVKLNYLSGKPDGLLGPQTRQAVERFERDRKLPVSGDLSPRTLRELAATSGLPVE